MRNILVIMNLFAPNNNSGAIPNTKLIKYLARSDVRITLITREIMPNMVIDNALLPKEMDRIHTIRVGHSALYSKTFEASRNAITDNGVKLKMKSETRPIRARIVNILKNGYLWSRDKDWYIQACARIRKELGDQHFDCVYSTFPNQVNHWVAEYIMKKGMADKWIADFRDPMFYEYHDAHNKYRINSQHRIERKADAVTIVSEGALSKFICDGVPLDKIKYIPNGYDPEDAADIANKYSTDPKTLRIFYAGTLYAGRRDFTVLFKALSELSNEGKINIDNISVEYAGNEWPIMESFAKKYNLLNCCKNYGFITRTQVMDILNQVDCSAVCSHNTKTDMGVVTGKVFELLMIEKPIIAVINGEQPNSELGKIVRQCNAGIVYEQATDETDYTRMKDWLLNIYEEKMKYGHVHSDIDRAKREQYSYENIAKELFNLMVN